MIDPMRLTEFEQLVTDEFGNQKAQWIKDSHVILELGGTARELIEKGVNPSDVWRGLCDDFDVPEERRLGRDV